MSDEAGAIWMPVPAANVFPGYWGNKPKWLVIHKTASGGTAQDIANFFIHDPARASSHYIIGQDGTIVQCVSEADGAGANCCLEAGHAPYLPTGINMNLLTISIEHCDPASDNSTPLIDAQKQASFRLVKDICQRHNIPMRAGDANGGIIGHHDISPILRARCPGNYPWQELFSFLNGGSSMGVPQGWSDDGHTLTAPNGHRVVLGFRDHVLNYAGGWPANNQPQEEEWHADPLELSNLSLGAGQKQSFNWTTLEWTPSMGVFEAYQGQEIVALRMALAKAQTPPPPPVNPDVAVELQTADAAIQKAQSELK